MPFSLQPERKGIGVLFIPLVIAISVVVVLILGGGAGAVFILSTRSVPPVVTQAPSTISPSVTAQSTPPITTTPIAEQNIPTQQGITPPTITPVISSPTPRIKETLTFPLTAGSRGATTTQSYQGPTTIQVSGTGQAAGKQSSDAFYIYTNDDGTPNTNPIHYTDFLSLCINSQPVDRFVQTIPAYSLNHTYIFIINAPGGLLTFGICDDTGQYDNTGSFSVMIF
jgi:hypothetical protein